MAFLWKHASLTRDVATPMENTVTSLLGYNSLSPVATPTAQQVTTIDADGRFVEGTTPRAFESGRLVSLAEIRGSLVVDEIS